MKYYLLITLHTLWLLFSFKAAAQSVVVSSKAINLLNESYNVARQLDGRERISYMVRLTRASASISPQSTIQWCDELFTLASQSPLDWNHVANQKNAAVPLGGIDPKRAMDMLARVAPPQLLDAGYPEDVRASAAATIFPQFLRAYGMEGLTQIEHQASDIGETGEYPFRAMGEVIGDVITSNKDNAYRRAGVVFQNAVSYYRKNHPKFEDEDEEFLEMLVSTKQLRELESYREGLGLLLGRISVPRMDAGAFAAYVGSTQGVVRLHDPNQLLLWRALPLVLEINSVWADELIEQNPELRPIEHGGELLGAGLIRGNPSVQYAEVRRRQMLESALLARIVTLSKTDPLAALQLANTLTTPPARIAAITSVLPVITRFNTKQASLFYAQELQELDEVLDSQGRIRGLASLAKSAFFVNDLTMFNALVREVLNRGEALFEKDIERRRAEMHNGYREMSDIVEFSAAHNVHWVVDRVEEMTDPSLKAYLLVGAAKGLSEADHHLVEEP